MSASDGRSPSLSFDDAAGPEATPKTTAIVKKLVKFQSLLKQIQLKTEKKKQTFIEEGFREEKKQQKKTKNTSEPEERWK